jgi:hypothetical protein
VAVLIALVVAGLVAVAREEKPPVDEGARHAAEDRADDAVRSPPATQADAGDGARDPAGSERPGSGDGPDPGDGAPVRSPQSRVVIRVRDEAGRPVVGGVWFTGLSPRVRDRGGSLENGTIRLDTSSLRKAVIAGARDADGRVLEAAAMHDAGDLEARATVESGKGGAVVLELRRR